MIQCDVKNTGKFDGAEVAQLYLTFPVSAGEPPMQLKGFKKVFIAAGSSATVKFPIRDRDLSIWDITSHGWKKLSGDFGVNVGASSRDIKLTGTLTV